MIRSTEIKRWLVFYTKPRAEKKAEIELKSKLIDVYLPLNKVVKRWSDRKVTIDEPLFKSYIFAYVNEKERLITLQSKTIVKNIHFSGKIAVVPDWQIDSIKKALEYRNESISIENNFVKGDKVKIIYGPLEGVEGIILHDKDANYILIEIESVGKTLKVKLNPEDLLKIETKSEGEREK